MPQPKLSKLLTLEKLEECYFRGESWDLGFRALFGGQVMGQALSAAQNTVPNDMYCHSFHCYFILAGDASMPVMYEVEKVRDGRSFSTRRTKAIQKGKVIFDSVCSFQIVEEGVTHQSSHMPDVPMPEEVERDDLCFGKAIEEMSSTFKEKLAYHKPIDMRTINNVQEVAGKDNSARRFVWMRLTEHLPHDPHIHQTSMAYASDYHFLITALQPHGISVRSKNLRIATIDHALWFHRPLDFNEWHLYCADSPSASGAKGYVRGQFFNRSGELVASSTQEGLIRLVNQ